MASSAASYSKILLLASLSLAWVVLRSWTLRECLSIIHWLWVGSCITICVLVRNSVLMSWPRSIPMCWTNFSHIVRILSTELFSPYVKKYFPRALDSPDFAFSFLKLVWCTLPAWIPLPLPERMPLPEPPLPLPMAVDCHWWYWPYFILGRISLSLKCRWSSLLGLGMLITLCLFGGCFLVPLCF